MFRVVFQSQTWRCHGFPLAQAEAILAHFVKVETLWSPWFYQGSGSHYLTTLLFSWYFTFRIQGFYLKLVGVFVHDHTIFSRFWLPKQTEKRLIFTCICESPAQKSLSPWGHGKCVQNQRTPLSSLPQGSAWIKGRTSHLKGSWGNKKPITWVILIKTLGVLAISDPSRWDWEEDGSKKISNISYLM